MVAMLKKLDAEDPARIQMSEKLLEKCFRMGLIPAKKSLTQCEQIAASCFARRWLPVVLVKNKFCETMREAVSFVEQRHIRVGPEVVTDPAFHVVRDMEVFITGSTRQKSSAKLPNTATLWMTTISYRREVCHCARRRFCVRLRFSGGFLGACITGRVLSE